MTFPGCNQFYLVRLLLIEIIKITNHLQIIPIKNALVAEMPKANDFYFRIILKYKVVHRFQNR